VKVPEKVGNLLVVPCLRGEMSRDMRDEYMSKLVLSTVTIGDGKYPGWHHRFLWPCEKFQPNSII
jgi:hypothetical protein